MLIPIHSTFTWSERTSLLNRSTGKYQSEYIIEDEVAALTIGHQLKDLGKIHMSLLFVDLKLYHTLVGSFPGLEDAATSTTYYQSSRNKYQDSTCFIRRLCISCSHLVLYFFKRKSLEER